MLFLKKGINCWCFPAEFEIEKCMEIAAEAGFEGIELNIEEEKKDSINLNSTDEEILRFKELSDKYNIEIISLATSLFWKYPLTSNQKVIREKAVKIIKKMIDAACTLEVDVILVVPGIVDREVSYQKAYQRALHTFRKIRPYAEGKGVKIGIENVWNKLLLSPLEMKRFIDEIDSPYVGFYLDVGNLLNYSYPLHWIEILADEIIKVHVKDFKIDIGNINGFTHLLQGDVDWEQVIRALRKIKYDDYLIAELSPYKTCPAQLAVDSANALQCIINL